MTKDHVVPDREGSSPFFRIDNRPENLKRCSGFFFVVGRKVLFQKAEGVSIEDFFDLERR